MKRIGGPTIPLDQNTSIAPPKNTRVISMARNFQIGGTHAAPPGSSLTQENNAWGNPPPITEVKDLYNMVRKNAQDPVIRNRLKKMMYAGVDISCFS